MHEPPEIPNFAAPPRTGDKIKAGMTLGHRADGERGKLQDEDALGWVTIVTPTVLFRFISNTRCLTTDRGT
jgi:hypothetical protein